MDLSLGDKDFTLSCILSLNNESTQNMDNWVICLLSLVWLSRKLGLISTALSVLPICSEEEHSAGSFPKQQLVIEPSWKFPLYLIKGMLLIYGYSIVSHLSLL